MENGLFIDGLPIKHGGSFHGYVSHNQGYINSLISGGEKYPHLCDPVAMTS